MAYYNNPNEDEEKELEQGMNGPVSLGSGSTPSSGGSAIPTGNMNSAAPKPASSGAKAGFSQYAKANQGNAQNRLNQSVGQNVQNQAQQATNSINQATTSFGKKVDTGSLKNREQAVQDVGNVVNSARNVTAAPAPVQAPPVSNQNQPTAAQPAAAPVAPSVSQQEQDRFKEVINARYQGPESLRQAGLYQVASGKVQGAQTALDRAKTAGGREDLLKSMYQNRADYTTGLNKLDAALLNSSQQGVQNLQNIAQAQGNIGQKLDQAQIASANLAKNRGQEIQNIQEQARNVFTQGKQAEEAATEERLSNVIKDWDKLPEHFREIIRNKEATNKAAQDQKLSEFYAQNKQITDADIKNAAKQVAATAGGEERFAFSDSTPEQRAQFFAMQKAAEDNYRNLLAQRDQYNTNLKAVQDAYNPNAVNLSAEEAAILGIDPGQGLYNLGADAIKTAQADKNKLISRDEQARQAVLSQLAGLDLQNRLDTNLRYGDANLAGTQSAIDALDLQATREGLNAAEKNFREAAQGTDLTGTGVKKVSRGNAFGKKTKTYRANVGGNVGQFLEQGGYDLDSEVGGGQEVSQQNLLKDYLRATDTTRNNADAEDNQKVLQSAGQGAGAGAAIGSLAGPMSGVGAAIGGMAGAALGAGSADQYQVISDYLRGMGGPAGAIGKGIQDVRREAGNASESALKYNPVIAPVDAIGKALGLGSLSSGISGAIGGIDSGAMKAYGDSIAKRDAIKDLERQYQGFLDTQGFSNRIGIQDNEQTNQRMSALQQILANMDKNNL